MSRRRDRRRMALALALARSGTGRTGENPSVGCVICDPEGRVIAQARTADGGRPHAEEIALGRAGPAARGATAYVTLEPCRERSDGSPACSERLLAADISRVVIAVRDRHHRGAGGLDRLEAAGLPVELGLKAPAAIGLYRAFFDHAIKGAMPAARPELP